MDNNFILGEAIKELDTELHLRTEQYNELAVQYNKLLEHSNKQMAAIDKLEEIMNQDTKTIDAYKQLAKLYEAQVNDLNTLLRLRGGSPNL